MAKGLITQATLTGIADAIRAKAGTSAVMRPDEMAALIQSISGGGKVAFGSVTPSGNYTRNVTITHNLGAVPNLIAIFAAEGIYTGYMVSLFVIPGYGYVTEVYYTSKSSIQSKSLPNNATNLANVFPTLTETTLTANSNVIQGSIYFNPGKYVWIAAEVSA